MFLSVYFRSFLCTTKYCLWYFASYRVFFSFFGFGFKFSIFPSLYQNFPIMFSYYIKCVVILINIYFFIIIIILLSLRLTRSFVLIVLKNVPRGVPPVCVHWRREPLKLKLLSRTWPKWPMTYQRKLSPQRLVFEFIHGIYWAFFTNI